MKIISLTEKELDQIKKNNEEEDGKEYKWGEFFPETNSGWCYTNCRYIALRSGEHENCLSLHGGLLLFRCLNCGAPHLMGKCEKCGSDKFFFDKDSSDWRIRYYKCGNCRNIVDLWRCSKCGAHNKILQNTNYQLMKAGGCFIATACYGSYNASDVTVLRIFRDKVLMNSSAGRTFVKVYYLIAPPMANFISKKETLKAIVRRLMIEPLIRALKNHDRRK